MSNLNHYKLFSLSLIISICVSINLTPLLFAFLSFFIPCLSTQCTIIYALPLSFSLSTSPPHTSLSLPLLLLLLPFILTITHTLTLSLPWPAPPYLILSFDRTDGEVTRESGTSASSPVFGAMVTLWNDMRLGKLSNIVYHHIIIYLLYFIQFYAILTWPCLALPLSISATEVMWSVHLLLTIKWFFSNTKPKLEGKERKFLYILFCRETNFFEIKYEQCFLKTTASFDFELLHNSL